MNNFSSHVTFKLMVLIFAVLIAVGQTAAQTENAQKRSRTAWEWSDDGWKRRVVVEGKAQFTQDYSDIESLTEGSVVTIEEDHHGQSRKLEITRDANGQVSRRYFVNGELRSLDDAGRKWMTGLLLLAVRQGAFDAEERTRRILRQRGVDGLLTEIAQMSGEYAKRIYFQALLNNKNLSSDELAKAVNAIGAQMTSDHEKANILQTSAPAFLEDTKLSSAFFHAVGTVGSDHERRRTLSSLLTVKNLREDVWLQMLNTAAGLISDHEKATFLVEASKVYDGNTRVRSTFLRTVETIKSDYERGRVLTALLRNKQLG